MDLKKYGIGKKGFVRIPVKSAAFNIVRSHGSECLSDYDALFWRQFWRMTNIADKYGFSRQRASQIFKKLYPGISMKDISTAKTELLKKEIRHNCQLDPIAKYEDLASHNGCGLDVGLNGESIVFKKMLDIGLDARSSQTRTIDSIVNGNNVEIKTATKPFIPSSNSPREYYRFNIKKKQTELADFFVLFIRDGVERFFIVPSSVTNGKIVYIPKNTERTSNMGRQPNNKFAQFEDAWHLLN